MKAVEMIGIKNSKGEVVYREMPLGNATSVVNLVNTGVQTVNQNTDGSAGIDPGAAKVAQIAGSIAGIAATIPGVGQIVAAVAAIIAGIATIIGKNKAKVAALRAERMQYELINAELINQNAQLDFEIARLKMAIDQMASALGIDLNALNGLGLCIFNCKKKEVEKLLSNAQALHTELLAEQEEKIQLVTDLALLAQSMVVAKNTKYVGWLIGAGALAIGVWYYFKNKK